MFYEIYYTGLLCKHAMYNSMNNTWTLPTGNEIDDRLVTIARKSTPHKEKYYIHNE